MPQAARAEDGYEHTPAARAERRARAATRETVTIRGRPERTASPRLHVVRPARTSTVRPNAPRPRVVHVSRRRPARPAAERFGSHPDRIAMWAVMMALALVVVAALSAHP